MDNKKDSFGAETHVLFGLGKKGGFGTASPEIVLLKREAMYFSAPRMSSPTNYHATIASGVTGVINLRGFDKKLAGRSEGLDGVLGLLPEFFCIGAEKVLFPDETKG